MTTPDTTEEAEPTEQEEALYEAVATTLEDITGRWRDNEAAHMMTMLRDPIAAITRQAAAEALLDNARSLERTGEFMRKQANSAADRQLDAIAYNNQADAFYRSATKLRTAAADKLAEGYEYECAAFNQECETRVPDAGDFCSKHEPEDDDDPRWAE